MCARIASCRGKLRSLYVWNNGRLLSQLALAVCAGPKNTFSKAWFLTAACSRIDAAICPTFPVVFQDTHEIGGHVETLDIVTENAVCCTQIHIYLCHTFHVVVSETRRRLSCITPDTRRSVYIYTVLYYRILCTCIVSFVAQYCARAISRGIVNNIL